MPSRKIIGWLLRILLLDKVLHILVRIRLRSLGPANWAGVLNRLPPIAAFAAWRSRRSHLVQHTLGNLVVGLGIAVLLWNLHGTHWIHEIEDTAIDWVMTMQWGVQPTRPSVPFALLDIDEATYRQWGEPFHIPRDRLLTLIKYAVEGDPALIVVDIDLSQRGHDPEADARLQDYFSSYDASGRPPLILSRVFREPLDPHTMPYRSPRRSFLEADERIARSPLIHWGSPLFNLDQDRVLRRWRLWEPVCTEAGHGDVVPSIQLLAVALLRSDRQNPEWTVHTVHKTLAPLAPEHCAGGHPDTDDPDGHGAHGGHGGHGSDETFEIAGLTLHTQPNTVAQRILYTQPWRLRTGQVRQKITWRGRDVSALSIRSALPIGRQPVDQSWLAGKVVVIGASFAESFDRHLTPLGEMPGVLVLINAIQSLHQHGELEAPPVYVKLLVEAVLIVMMSLVFACFTSFWGMVVSGVVIVLALLPLSFIVFQYGVWLDFAIPLIAVQLHQMAESLREAKPQHPHQVAHGHAPALSLPVTLAKSNPQAQTHSIGDDHEPQQTVVQHPGADGDNVDAGRRNDLDQGLSGRPGGPSAGERRQGHGDPVLPDPPNR